MLNSSLYEAYHYVKMDFTGDFLTNFENREVSNDYREEQLVRKVSLFLQNIFINYGVCFKENQINGFSYWISFDFI